MIDSAIFNIENDFVEFRTKFINFNHETNETSEAKNHDDSYLSMTQRELKDLQEANKSKQPEIIMNYPRYVKKFANHPDPQPFPTHTNDLFTTYRARTDHHLRLERENAEENNESHSTIQQANHLKDIK